MFVLAYPDHFCAGKDIDWLTQAGDKANDDLFYEVIIAVCYGVFPNDSDP